MVMMTFSFSILYLRIWEKEMSQDHALAALNALST